MKKFDDTDDPRVWLAEYNAWKRRNAAALNAQDRAYTAYQVALASAQTQEEFRSTLAEIADRMGARTPSYADVNSRLAAQRAALDDLEGFLSDHEIARDTATSRLLAGPDLTHPLVLLPVRVHTAWRAGTLCVRVLPSEISVDRHDPRLSDLEITLGTAYWATRQLPGPAAGPTEAQAQAQQAWADLTRRVPAQRAAWIVAATDPSRSGAPPRRDDALDPAVTVRLLPDRFAVVLLAAGEPINLAAPGAAPTYLTWGAEIATDLTVPLLGQPGEPHWSTDFDAALESGMGLRVTVPPGAPGIDELVVVGVRAGSAPGDLADLLEAHLYSAGLEVLLDGTETNNSSTGRTVRTSTHDQDVLGHLVLHPGPATSPQTSAGRQLADLLGIDRSRTVDLPGAGTDRGSVPAAMATLVNATVSGTLDEQIGATGPDLAAVTALAPGGPGPAVRIGAQPFGILPVADPSRWASGTGPVDEALGRAVAVAAQIQTLPLDVDPAAPPPPAPQQRRVTRADDTPLVELLGEHASSIGWRSGSEQWEGLDRVVGTETGPQAPATYLEELASGTRTAEVITAASACVLGTVALAATAPGATTAGVEVALRQLAAAAAGPGGREHLAALLGDQLDAHSHRLDVWVTAAVTRRRLTATTGAPVIGAYGYLADVAPRTSPRSFGHVHAPSLGHAATAAVLRSGYLSQRRAAWAARLVAATAAGDLAAADAARTGLVTLAPLDPAAEGRLPMAIDLSSRRVREANALLDAVRSGQPLGAVLGQEFERGLAQAGLLTHLAAFRKLTRFATGTELEKLEDARRDAAEKVAQVEDTLLSREGDAAATGPLVTAAQAAQAVTAARLARARAANAPYAALVEERRNVQVAYDADNATIANLSANRPGTTKTTRTVTVPVP